MYFCSVYFVLLLCLSQRRFAGLTETSICVMLKPFLSVTKHLLVVLAVSGSGAGRDLSLIVRSRTVAMAAASSDSMKRSRSLDPSGAPPSPSGVGFQRMKDIRAQQLKTELRDAVNLGDAQRTLSKLVEIVDKAIDALADAVAVT